MYKIFFHKKVIEDLEGIPSSHLKAIKKAISERLASHPYDFKPLSGKKYKGLYRLRISDFRIIYRIIEEESSVKILAIGHRRMIYEEFDRRENFE
jgi:mRNA interferase RelE/StbE